MAPSHKRCLRKWEQRRYILLNNNKLLVKLKKNIDSVVNLYFFYACMSNCSQRNINVARLASSHGAIR